MYRNNNNGDGLSTRSSNRMTRFVPASEGSAALDAAVRGERDELQDLVPHPLVADGPVGVTPGRLTVSLVIPARNEARNLAWVLERIPSCVDEVILVDGSSTDATLAMAALCRPGIRQVGQAAPGKGEALRAGFAAARGDIIVMIDADGSMNPEEIPQYIWYLEHGYDFVKGSRFLSGGGSLDFTRLRRVGNRSLMTLVNARFGAQLTDLCYGFCAFRRWWLPSLGLAATGFEIETEMTLQALTAGLRVTEVPSLEMPRRSGESALHTFRDGWRVLQTILRTPTRRLGPAGPEGAEPVGERPAMDGSIVAGA